MAGYGNFTSQQNQTPTDKISTSVGSSSISAASKDFASALSGKLVAAGASISAVASNVTNGLDKIASSLKGDVSSLSQNVLQRTDPQTLISKRNKFSETGSTGAANQPTDAMAANKTAFGSKLIMYPPDMRKYYINFAFGEYVRPNSYRQSTFNINQHIALPMPSNLVTPMGVKLNSTELGGIVGAAAENIAAVIQEIGQRNQGPSTTMSTSEANQQLSNQTAGSLYNIAVPIAGLIPAGSETLTQLVGAVPNPHITVLFQGVDLKTHQFTWRFAPKNVGESQTIQQIIREFKKRMLPNYKWGAANVLGYPNMVQITLEPDMKDQLYIFKKCMISSVNVNYAPNGVPSFFAGSKYPTVIEFSVSLQELEIHTSQDYGGKNGDTNTDADSYKQIQEQIRTSLSDVTAPKQ
jgi:hypothetical protein